MKTSCISTAKTIFTLIVLFTFSLAAQANINGTWINEKSNTRNITKVIIHANNTVQVFGSCSPSDCDWGTTSLQYKGQTRIGKRYTAEYDQGFAKRTLVFYKQSNGKLYLQAGYSYTDSRPAQKHTEYFVKETCGGYQGIVTDNSNRNLKLSGVTIRFTSEDGSTSKTTTSSSNGSYRIELAQGRYKVKAAKSGYETYTTAQGFFVVNCQGMQTGNIFMKKKAPTTNRGRGSSSLKEDCVNFNPKNLRVKLSNRKYLLVDGTHSVKAFSNKSEAYEALKIIQHYGINQSCFVGRPNPSFTYLLVNGKAPMGGVSGDDCIGFNPNTIALKKINNSWKIVDGSQWMFDFGANYTEAKQAFQIIKKYGFTQSCFVGRPNPSLQYMIK